MVYGSDDHRLKSLLPLFSPSSVAAILIELETAAEDTIRAAMQQRQRQQQQSRSSSGSCEGESDVPFCDTSACRHARSELHLNLLLALRACVERANRRELLQMWCCGSSTSSSSSSTIITSTINNNRDLVEARVQYKKELALKQPAGSAAEAEDDVSEEKMLQVMLELPSMLLLCAFSLCYLSGIPSARMQAALLQRAVKIVKAPIRDNIAVDEILSFGMALVEISGASEGLDWERWLGRRRQDSEEEKDEIMHLVHPSSFLSVNTMALLWALTSSSSSSSSIKRGRQGASSQQSHFIPIMSDPHLLLWNAWSPISLADAIVCESARECHEVFCLPPSSSSSSAAAAAAANATDNDDDDEAHRLLLAASGVKSRGVIVLLVQDAREWNEAEILDLCGGGLGGLSAATGGCPVVVWVDTHSAGLGQLHRALCSSPSWGSSPVLLEWMSDALLGGDSCETEQQQQQQQQQIESLVNRWLHTAISASGVATSREKAISVRNAARGCIRALDEAATSICSDELSKLFCGAKSTSTSSTTTSSSCDEGGSNTFSTCCWMGLLAHVVSRLPDCVPASGGGSTTGGFVPTEIRRLASFRVAAPQLPPGISISPDSLLIFRIAENLPADFFASLWVSLLGPESTYRTDPTLAKMSPRWSSLIAPASSATSNNAASDSAVATTTSGNDKSVIDSSAEMSRAFTFVLSSWWDEPLLPAAANLSLEESVGRFKNVADSVERHRAVEVRAFGHSVATSRAELRQMVEAQLRARFASVQDQLNKSGGGGGGGTSCCEEGEGEEGRSEGGSSAAGSSAAARASLAAVWRSLSATTAAKNLRSAMIVAQQVAAVFEREAQALVDRLTDGGGESDVCARAVLRLRPELERLARYHDQAMATAVDCLGAKGRHLLAGSSSLQKNMKLLRNVL